MARVKKAVNAKKKHKKILKLSKGFYGQKSKVFRAANPAVLRSLSSAYVGRKRKKEITEDFGLQESTPLQGSTVFLTVNL